MENSTEKPEIIKGGFAVDERGQVTFCNEFDFKDVKRFYILENFSTDTIRAFHGHLHEEKYMFLVSGTALVCVVKLDDVEKPSKENEVHRFILSVKNPSILHIPAGFVNGLRFLEKDTKMIVFSTSSLEESKKDDYRFPYDYWGKDIWEVKNY